jgi:NAD(P)-dependent dehydrogenase (short-subunit alcohol dehydrogenase family)
MAHQQVEHFDLTGKRCVVFGSDGPAGSPVADAFEEAGANVVKLDSVPAASVSETVGSAIDSLGGVDVLAWASDLFLAKPFVEVQPGEIGAVMMGNFASAFAATQCAVARMLEQGTGGNVVLVTHVLGERGLPNTTVYSAAHGALQNFIRALAQEVAPAGISVNGVALGWMAWMSDRLDEKDPEAARAIRFTMAKRAGIADDIGPMAVWLAGSGVGFVTGQIFPLDGGLTQHL